MEFSCRLHGLLVILSIIPVLSLDPAAYGNPSGQLSTKQPEQMPKDSYERQYIINVANRGESCFFIENLKEGYLLSVHYTVLTTKSGAQLDISMRLKDPATKLVTFQARKKEGHYSNYKVTTPGDFELCFNNRYSMYEHKKLMWEVSVEGDEDEEDSEEALVLAINRTMEEFDAHTKEINAAVRKVRMEVARARHQQYWVKSKNSRDIERMASLQSMIDTWSGVNSVLVAAVGICQILVIRSFFNVKPTTSNLRMRT